MQVYGEPFGDDDAFIAADICAQGQLTIWICNPPVALMIKDENNLDLIITALQAVKNAIP